MERVIRSHQSKKESHGQTRKDKGTNTDLQNITQKPKDRATLTPPKGGKVCSSCSTCGTRHIILVTKLVISHVMNRDRTDNNYDKLNISVVICDTDIP